MSDGMNDVREIGLEKALALLAQVREAAAGEGLAVSAAVCDRGGNAVASARMDGAALGAMPLAVDKAYTAVLWQVPTGEFMQSTQPGGVDWGFNTTRPAGWSCTRAACRSSWTATWSAGSA
jgi:uncharacterized protein GlcG (DUF336 family)